MKNQFQLNQCLQSTGSKGSRWPNVFPGFPHPRGVQVQQDGLTNHDRDPGCADSRRNRFQQAGHGCAGSMMNRFLHGQNPGYAVPMDHGSSRIVLGSPIPVGLGSGRTVPAQPISWVCRSPRATVPAGESWVRRSSWVSGPAGRSWVRQSCEGPVPAWLTWHSGYTGPRRFWLQRDGRLFSHGSAFQHHSQHLRSEVVPSLPPEWLRPHCFDHSRLGDLDACLGRFLGESSSSASHGAGEGRLGTVTVDFTWEVPPGAGSSKSTFPSGCIDTESSQDMEEVLHFSIFLCLHGSHRFWWIKTKDFSRTFPGPNLTF